MTTTTIEHLLRWALLLEMPKGQDHPVSPGSGPSAWAAIERVGELGTMIDGSGGGGFHEADPHPDALAVAAAVAALDGGVIEEGVDHDLLAGWPDFGDAGAAAVWRAWDIITLVDDHGQTVTRSSLAALVRRVALLGRWPDWRCETPSLALEVGPEGSARWHRLMRIEVRWSPEGVPIAWADVEVDGWDRVRRRPHKGAYRKSVLVPDVSGALARRLEYGLTHAALTGLAAALDGLGGRRVLPPDRSPTPWADAGDVEKIVA